MKGLCILSVIFISAFTSCNRNKTEELANYNNEIINYVEIADNAFNTWRSADMLSNYKADKLKTEEFLNTIEDSIKDFRPLKNDDTLRLAALAVVSSYLQSLSIYDTIERIINDSVYQPADSIRVENLLNTAQNIISEQASAFSQTQKRFAARHKLEFAE
jgi:hypothetical protein